MVAKMPKQTNPSKLPQSVKINTNNMECVSLGLSVEAVFDAPLADGPSSFLLFTSALKVCLTGADNATKAGRASTLPKTHI